MTTAARSRKTQRYAALLALAASISAMKPATDRPIASG